MLHKNLPRKGRGWRLTRRRLLDTMAWAKFVATADFKNASAVVKAHRDFARMRGMYDTDPSVNLLVNRPNILIEYFAKGKRKYSELEF